MNKNHLIYLFLIHYSTYNSFKTTRKEALLNSQPSHIIYIYRYFFTYLVPTQYTGYRGNGTRTISRGHPPARNAITAISDYRGSRLPATERRYRGMRARWQSGAEHADVWSAVQSDGDRPLATVVARQ